MRVIAASPGRGHLLVRQQSLARQDRHAHKRLFLGHDG